MTPTVCRDDLGREGVPGHRVADVDGDRQGSRNERERHLRRRRVELLAEAGLDDRAQTEVGPVGPDLEVITSPTSAGPGPTPVSPNFPSSRRFAATTGELEQAPGRQARQPAQGPPRREQHRPQTANRPRSRADVRARCMRPAPPRRRGPPLMTCTISRPRARRRSCCIVPRSGIAMSLTISGRNPGARAPKSVTPAGRPGNENAPRSSDVTTFATDSRSRRAKSAGIT